MTPARNNAAPNYDYNPLLGIDLGTTFSAIARFDGRGPQHYLTAEGKDTLQSAVYVHKGSDGNDEILVGQLAYNKGLRYGNLALGFKRQMDNADAKFHLRGKDYSPIELSALVLRKLHGDVKAMFPEGVFKDRGVVVTVPYYFKANEMNNTRLAVEAAGLTLIELVPEPVAASLLYAWEIGQANLAREIDEKILVFDLGGGTFDVTVFHLHQTAEKLIFKVLSTNGDSRLGGMDFDKCLMDYSLQKSGISLEGLNEIELALATQKLAERVIEAKESLSFSQETELVITDLIPGRHVDLKLTRGEFEESISKYIEGTPEKPGIRAIVNRVLSDADVTASELSRIVKVGGSSKIPCFHKLLDDLAHGTVYGNLNPSLCVAQGAAMFAAFRKDPQLLGREIEVCTVNNHNLGVEVHNGDLGIIIAKNRVTPCEQRKTYGLAKDNVTTFQLKVYQGASKKARDNTLVGEIPITGLPARKAGELRIVVTFKVGADQTLKVTVDVPEAGIHIENAMRFQ